MIKEPIKKYHPYDLVNIKILAFDDRTDCWTLVDMIPGTIMHYNAERGMYRVRYNAPWGQTSGWYSVQELGPVQ